MFFAPDAVWAAGIGGWRMPPEVKMARDASRGRIPGFQPAFAGGGVVQLCEEAEEHTGGHG